jgi:putative hydrolase of the HAD superfamily
MTGIKAVCFDLDDTLYDYEQYAKTGLRSAADRLESRTGHSFHDELLSMYFEEGITEGTFDRLLDRHDLPAHLIGELVEAYHSATEPLSPYEDTVPVLAKLSEAVPVGLLTDGRGGHSKLRRLGIEKYFDAVLVTPTIGYSKREPEVFDAILSDLWVSAEDAVYVGDDPRFDFRIPNEFGMTTVRLRRGRHADLEPQTADAAPDLEIDRLSELGACLSTMVVKR